jgi:alpha-L-fucosidase
MDVNSESIVGTTASPVEKYCFDGRITTKGKVHYLFVFKRPEKGVITVPFIAKKATLLVGGHSLALTAGPSETSIELPAELPDPVATVIRLE